jgi:hypothetical protein
MSLSQSSSHPHILMKIFKKRIISSSLCEECDVIPIIVTYSPAFFSSLPNHSSKKIVFSLHITLI